jgi:hypothetical protein
MKRNRALISFVLVLTILIGLLAPASAAPMLRASSYIDSFFADCMRTGNAISVGWDIAGNGQQKILGVSEISLYEKVGSTTTCVKTWYMSSTTSMIAYNSRFHCGTNLYYGAKTNAQYYAVVTFIGGASSSACDTRTYTTATIK